MEQIAIELVIKNSRNNEWEEDKLERNDLLIRFPQSVPVATSFLEMDYAEAWLSKAFGPKGAKWEVYFYYKENYDFGYAEYFFQDESVFDSFKNEIPNLYGVFAKGKKLKTNCQGEYFDVE